MKKLVSYLFAVVLITFTSCEKDDHPQSGEKVNVSFNHGVEPTALKAGLYDRGTAPAYVDGVYIDADNVNNDLYDDLNNLFEFVDPGNTGKAIGLELEPGD